MTYLNKEKIYDILVGCSLFDVYTKEYGTLSVLDIDDIMEEFIPEVIDYINENLEEDELFLENT